MRGVALLCLLGAVGCGSESDDTCDTEGGPCALEKKFADEVIAPGVDDPRRCVLWKLDNDETLYVVGTEILNGGGVHHSNWYFVPDNVYDFEDGNYACDDIGYSDVSSAVLGGVIAFQSVASDHDVNEFPDGVAVPIPPHSRIAADIHVLNAGEQEIVTPLELTLTTVPSADVSVKLAPFEIFFNALGLPPMSKSEFNTDCDVATARRNVTGNDDFSMNIYWLQPHYHENGIYLQASFSGGPRDGEEMFRFEGPVGDSTGQVYPDPIRMQDEGATGIKLVCGYDNMTDGVIEFGYGDGEMCVLLGFAEADVGWIGSISSNTETGTLEDGTVVFDGACGASAVPWDL